MRKNEFIFEDEPLNSLLISSRIQSKGWEYGNANVKQAGTVLAVVGDGLHNEVSRCLLSANLMKINIDGAFVKGSMKAGLGVIIINSSGDPIDGVCEQCWLNFHGRSMCHEEGCN